MPTVMPDEKPPAARMLDLIVGYWISCGVHVAARLSVADHLAQGPKSADEIARASAAHAPTLRRLLRMLSSCGVFREAPDGRFENTQLSETLRTDAPASLRGFAVMAADGYNLEAWKELEHSVRTGETAFTHVYGLRAFEWLASHPKEAKEFGEAMTSISGAENPAIAAAYDFSGIQKLVDVGGSHGSLMAAILKKTPGLRGVVYDRPEVVENAKQDVHLRAKGIAERCEVVAGDFFESVPSGGDAYLMKYILHDWEDELCARILGNCRKALASGGEGKGRVLVVDNVIPPGNAPHWGKLLDVHMLALAGGRERTKEEFEKLFSAAGFRLARVIPTACPLSIVEGIAL